MNMKRHRHSVVIPLAFYGIGGDWRDGNKGDKNIDKRF